MATLHYLTNEENPLYPHVQRCLIQAIQRNKANSSSGREYNFLSNVTNSGYRIYQMRGRKPNMCCVNPFRPKPHENKKFGPKWGREPSPPPSGSVTDPIREKSLEIQFQFYRIILHPVIAVYKIKQVDYAYINKKAVGLMAQLSAV